MLITNKHVLKIVLLKNAIPDLDNLDLLQITYLKDTQCLKRFMNIILTCTNYMSNLNKLTTE